VQITLEAETPLGSCELFEDLAGHPCAQSRNRDTSEIGYDSGDSCRLTVEGLPSGSSDPLMIRFSNFSTESGYDTLTVNGVALSGDGLDSKFFALETTEIRWAADHIVVAAGWAFCIIANGETDGEGESYASGNGTTVQGSGESQDPVGRECTMASECETGTSRFTTLHNQQHHQRPHIALCALLAASHCTTALLTSHCTYHCGDPSVGHRRLEWLVQRWILHRCKIIRPKTIKKILRRCYRRGRLRRGVCDCHRRSGVPPRRAL
jgi:hypothetical protein